MWKNLLHLLLGMLYMTSILSIVLAIIITVVGLAFILTFVHIDDMTLPQYFFGENNLKANGEFLTLVGAGVGGLFVIYGLILNNKRIHEQSKQIKEQNRQNTIAERNNSDKRFGEAIGYLSNDNTSVILGGVYALYQLAKEDERYIPIVANMFCSYLSSKSSILYKEAEGKVKKIVDENTKGDTIIEQAISSVELEKRYRPDAEIIMQGIIDCLFDEVGTFKKEQINISNATFKNVRFNQQINGCYFFNCYFLNVSFYNQIRDSVFSASTFQSVLFIYKKEYPILTNCKIYSNEFIGEIGFNYGIIEDSEFEFDSFDCIYTFSNIHFINSRLTPIFFELIKFCHCKFTNTKAYTSSEERKIEYIDCYDKPNLLGDNNI